MQYSTTQSKLRLIIYSAYFCCAYCTKSELKVSAKLVLLKGDGSPKFSTERNDCSSVYIAHHTQMTSPLNFFDFMQCVSNVFFFQSPVTKKGIDFEIHKDVLSKNTRLETKQFKADTGKPTDDVVFDIHGINTSITFQI